MKRILLDNQALVWIRMDHPELTVKARKAYLNAGSQIYLSIVSLWEIAIKRTLGKLHLEGTLKEFVDSASERLGVALLPLTVDHISKLEEMPLHHRDPFDRILIAQALQERMYILGNDPAFDAYGVRRIW